MLRMAAINRVVSRYRRATALMGAMVILGTAALNTHAALPEHHHTHGETTLCVASLSIAVLAALGMKTKRSTGPTIRLGRTAVVQIPNGLVVESVSAVARAGPSGALVLRL
jgi:hypothetical protein